ncbi:hypothetical protein DN069_36990, partial [Streptacidiphilus pinicola]
MVRFVCGAGVRWGQEPGAGGVASTRACKIGISVWLGRRLRGVPLASVHHGPLPRAAQTARLVAGQLGGLPLCESEAAGDYVPYV